MPQEHARHIGPTVEAANESEHAAKVARAHEILALTYHDPTAVNWPDHAIKAEAFAMAGKKPSECPSCNIDVIDYLRNLAGLHSIKKEAPPALHRQRLDICRGSERKGIPRCEHLAFTNLNCGLCLCLIDVKSRMKYMKCPANKWPK